VPLILALALDGSGRCRKTNQWPGTPIMFSTKPVDRGAAITDRVSYPERTAAQRKPRKRGFRAFLLAFLLMVLGVIDYGMLGWWVIWLIGFVAMTLAGGKGDRLNPLGLFANAIFAPLVITIMIGIFSLPLIVLARI
jgi:hypothetical protein